MSATPDRAWFARPALEVAHDLLGAVLTRRDGDGEVSLRITEVEAYAGERDPGSHAVRGPSARNAVMFGPPGRLYTYRHLGLHTCLNIVCGPDGEAAAVLLRAGQVVDGAPLALARRRAVGVVGREKDLASGPARLTVALGVTMAESGADLLGPDAAVRLARAQPLGADRVGAGPRVGVSGEGGDGELFPWRLWITDDPTVSRYRAAAPRRPRSGSRPR